MKPLELWIDGSNNNVEFTGTPEELKEAISQCGCFKVVNGRVLLCEHPYQWRDLETR